MAGRDLANKVTFYKRAERNGRAVYVSGERVFQEEGIEYMKDLMREHTREFKEQKIKANVKKGTVLGAEVRDAAGDQSIESFTDHIKEHALF